MLPAHWFPVSTILASSGWSPGHGGLQTGLWRITTDISGVLRDGDMNIDNWGCVIMSVIVYSPDNVEAATEEVMSWQWRWAGPPTMGGSHAGTSPELWAEDGRISQRKEQLHRDRNCMKPLVKYTKLYWDWRSVSKCWTIWVPSIILPTIFQQERKTLPGKT